MHLTLRAKLIAIVASTAVAFLALIFTSAYISRQVTRRLNLIQDVYVPRIELGPTLENQLAKLTAGFQNAAAASDADALAETRDLQSGFLELLAKASVAVDADQAATLRSAVNEYYVSAFDVVKRIIAEETGEALTEAMASMQAKQRRVDEALREATALDREDLAAEFSNVAAADATARRVRQWVSVACLAAVLLLSFWLGRGVLGALRELSSGFARFGRGEFDQHIPDSGGGEIAAVARQANQMARSLQTLAAERDRRDWLKAGHAGLAQELRGELEPEEAAARAVRYLATWLDAPAGALYGQDGTRLRLLAHHAASTAGSGPTPGFALGEGLVGQAALREDLVVVAEPPEDYLRIRSGLGEGVPRAIALVPIARAGKVLGVLELAFFKPWSEPARELLLSVRETVAIALDVARSRAALRSLLAETQEQARKLASQDEVIRARNDELHVQQEELRQTNEELTQQTEELETQRQDLLEKNLALDEAGRALERKADELKSVSTYKSQFLTSMSHELRTPLNSMLLLSNMLAENEAANLTEKQVEYCRTIFSAGKDLLALINQVLDLSKVEAGKQEVRIAPVRLAGVVDRARRVFEPMARDKGLAWAADVAPELPETILTDGQRVDQILTNLIGNAIKFTSSGGVELHVRRPPGRPTSVAFAVTDTGPGIAPGDRERIFAPFEQLDRRTNRRYGGTGLGLALARELAGLLGGELALESAPGAGSTFLFTLPEAPGRPADPGPAAVDDDRDAIGPGEPHLLVVEDDRVFAGTFGDVAHSYGLKYVWAQGGGEGLRLARERRPSGIVLDVRLPDTDGFSVMAELRADPATAAIPVHFVSAVDAAERGLAMGAAGYLVKPATRRDLVGVIESLVPKLTERARRILVVEDDALAGESLVKRLVDESLDARQVTSAGAALDAIRAERFGCLILDLSLPDMDGLELLRRVQEECGDEMPAVVVYTARALSRAETMRLEAYTESIVLKEGPSADRVLNEVRLFIRRLRSGGAPRRPIAPRTGRAELQLGGRKVLVVDDDMRTLYALSAALRAKGVEVFAADTGRAALDMLAEHPDIEAVLMDIMMPEMDGYEAMRQIRLDKRFLDLPIVALTAKAMKGDQDKCLEAGANDYMAKPVDAERLLELLQSRLQAAP